MFPSSLSERLDTLIDDLILDGGVESASLASILLAAKDSVKREYHVTLSRWVWTAVNEMKVESTPSALEMEFEGSRVPCEQKAG